jgi:hypothetical protein
MGSGSRSQSSDPFVSLRRRLERWRSRRSPGQRIPEELWASALELARVHGISKTAIGLRMDYYSVKRRLESVPVVEESAEFVEVPFGALLSGSECIVELEDGHGARLRVELKGQATSELASVVLALWQGSR